MKILFATHNEHKLEEGRQILGPLGYVVTTAQLPEVVEDGDTFEANALLKARAAADHTDLVSVADDSGLVVDALDGAPGIHSARYAGVGASDADKIEKLLRALGDDPNRTARFVCAIAVVTPSGDARTFRGVCEGVIVSGGPRGHHGFGYDPVFQPAGFSETYAQLDADRKNQISHRALAFAQLPALLAELNVGVVDIVE